MALHSRDEFFRGFLQPKEFLCQTIWRKMTSKSLGHQKPSLQMFHLVHLLLETADTTFGSEKNLLKSNYKV